MASKWYEPSVKRDSLSKPLKNGVSEKEILKNKWECGECGEGKHKAFGNLCVSCAPVQFEFSGNNPSLDRIACHTCKKVNLGRYERFDTFSIISGKLGDSISPAWKSHCLACYGKFAIK